MNSNFFNKCLELQNISILYIVMMYLLSPYVYYFTLFDLPSFVVNENYLSQKSIIISIIVLLFFYFGSLIAIKYKTIKNFSLSN